jgi:uncharacterized paraquat-inducible protein A
MGVKTFNCPNCTCVNVLPQVDDDGTEVKCVHCKIPVTITKTGKISTPPIATS